MSSERIESFLREQSWNTATRESITDGASTRTYTRLRKTDGSSAILMDAITVPTPDFAPYEQYIAPDLSYFVRSQVALRKLGLRVPTIFARLENDLLLVEDFAENQHYTTLLQNGAAPLPLYHAAIDALLDTQQQYEIQKPDMTGQPHYTPDVFLQHLAIFIDHYLPVIAGQDLSAAAVVSFKALWRDELNKAFATTPASLMMRDYAPPNLFFIEGKAALIDFENTGPGPMMYDIAALLQNHRYTPTPPMQEAVLEYLFTRAPQLDRAAVAQARPLFSALRQVTFIGQCALNTKQGRTGFLEKIPAIWRVVEEALEAPALALLKNWFDTHIPAPLRAAKDKQPA